MLVQWEEDTMLKDETVKQEYCAALQQKATAEDLWTGIKEAYTSTTEEVLGYRKSQKQHHAYQKRSWS